jgi:hypothetical protein
MNEIPAIQNTPQQLCKLLVEDEYYSRAKLWHGLQIILVVFSSATLSLIAVLCEKWGPTAAIYSAVVTLVDFYLLDPSINRLKLRAASVRECFDLDVLSLPLSPFRPASISIEDIVAISDPLPLAQEKKKINWYPIAIQVIPIEPARLICQRSSMQYDERLRNSYRFLWIGLFATIVLLLLLWCFIINPNFYRIAIITSSILPAALFCIKQNQLNEEACAKIATMRAFFDSIWQKLLSSDINPNSLAKASREIQDELFLHRSQRPLVPNFYYYLQRAKNEKVMNDAALDYVKKYQAMDKH